MLITRISQQGTPPLPAFDTLVGVSKEVAADLAAQIDRRGYAELPDLFSPAQIKEARTQAEAALAEAGGVYAGLDGPAGLEGAILRDLSESDAFATLCRALATRLGDMSPAPVRFGQTLRCLSGGPRRHARYFHYDSYLLTVIVPVAIPASGQSGDLLLWPTARPIRRNYLFNVAEKVVVERRVVQYLLGRIAARSRSLVRLRLTPGSVYIFDGYRTLHANDAVDAGALRATLVLHAIDPHGKALTKRVLGRVRQTLDGAVVA